MILVSWPSASQVHQRKPSFQLHSDWSWHAQKRKIWVSCTSGSPRADPHHAERMELTWRDTCGIWNAHKHWIALGDSETYNGSCRLRIWDRVCRDRMNSCRLWRKADSLCSSLSFTLIGLICESKSQIIHTDSRIKNVLHQNLNGDVSWRGSSTPED